MASMNDTNGGLYMALMQQFGAKEEPAAFLPDVAGIRPIHDHVHAGPHRVGGLPVAD